MSKTNLPTMVFFDVSAVAKALGVHPNTVRKLIASGRLGGVKIGGAVRVSEQALTDYLDASGMKKPAEMPRPARKDGRHVPIQHHFA